MVGGAFVKDVLQKQMDEMTDNELKGVLQRTTLEDLIVT